MQFQVGIAVSNNIHRFISHTDGFLQHSLSRNGSTLLKCNRENTHRMKKKCKLSSASENSSLRLTVTFVGKGPWPRRWHESGLRFLMTHGYGAVRQCFSLCRFSRLISVTVTPRMGRVLRELSAVYTKEWNTAFPLGNPQGPISF